VIHPHAWREVAAQDGDCLFTCIANRVNELIKSQTSLDDESLHVGPDDVRQALVDAMEDHKARLEPYCKISPHDQTKNVDYAQYCLEMRAVRLLVRCLATTPNWI
jgi:hypothetical protein